MNRRFYTTREIAVIRRIYASGTRTPARDAAAALNRTVNGIRDVALRFGISKPRKTPQEIDVIRRCYASASRTPAKDAAGLIGSTPDLVRKLASDHGIRRTRNAG